MMMMMMMFPRYVRCGRLGTR